MKTDIETAIDRFLDRKYSSANNCYSDGEKFYHFGTCLAQWTENGLLVNMTKYSSCTSRRQNLILRLAYGKVTQVTNVPMYTNDLKCYAA